ncbi:MAG: hypothetical protein ABIO71_10845 [Caldimonas sp.]
MKSAAARVESLTWPCIFGGMALAGLGLALRRADNPYAGWAVIAAGGVLVLVGVVLVWVRSRLDDPAPPLS